MKATMSTDNQTTAHLQLIGDVQGYGIRPTVANLARQLDLHGSVRNCRQGVDIVLHGPNVAIQAFRESLSKHFPNVSQSVRIEFNAERTEDFRILQSASEGAVQFAIPRDRVICENCLREIQTPGNRRFGYAFNSCTQCGPRYSIIFAMPYDRSQTSMSAFEMCSACQAEFADPTHRRFHAQTNCCPDCGPTLWFEENGKVMQDSSKAIAAAAQAILQGRVLALKGLGGYQLVCDATNSTVVDQLRVRKHRRSKPFALMVASIQAAHTIAELNEQEKAALKSPAGPIVLLRYRANSCLASNIHSGFRSVGAMLPTTALHAMLLSATQVPLVVTSGNIEGEPLEYREEEATQKFSGIADCFLHHDRPIVNPIDDSVVQAMAGRLVTLRAARGLAPMSIKYHTPFQVIALGGQQKSAVALSNGHATVLGPHLGDLDTVQSRERFLRQENALMSLMNCDLPRFVCDQHPDFFTSQIANVKSKLECQTIQHHHAHVVSAMVEQGWMKRTALGFAFDGTGLGSDGTLWGGEVLVTDATSFHRVGHLRSIRLVGGDLAAREPRRISLSLLMDAIGEQKTMELVDQTLLSNWQVDRARIEQFVSVLNRESLLLRTSSMGRLFDGIAALVCRVGHVSFEGEAAMRLESTCNLEISDAYHFIVGDESPFELDWRPLVRELVVDLASSLPEGTIAMKFHRAIAEGIASIGLRFPELPIVLAGGVFQNRTLVELVDKRLREQSSQYAMPCGIPPNDGGLAIGQLAVAASRMEKLVCA
ncbi:MAG: carbamoyltransferase HypF [Planctomycetota bacterium]|nr:carbamoyltransferase HypF [Planctomycetota bacterium]